MGNFFNCDQRSLLIVVSFLLTGSTKRECSIRQNTKVPTTKAVSMVGMFNFCNQIGYKPVPSLRLVLEAPRQTTLSVADISAPRMARQRSMTTAMSGTAS
jgi:hypothetical protein